MVASQKYNKLHAELKVEYDRQMEEFRERILQQDLVCRGNMELGVRCQR